jgi:hypothetical protein
VTAESLRVPVVEDDDDARAALRMLLEFRGDVLINSSVLGENGRIVHTRGFTREPLLL